MDENLVNRLRSLAGIIPQKHTLPSGADTVICSLEAFMQIKELAEEAANALEELSKPRWIPVTERLPTYGTPVLAYGSRGGIFIAKYERARAEWDMDYWWKLNSSIHVCNPTHWMPIPQPPKEE